MKWGYSIRIGAIIISVVLFCWLFFSLKKDLTLLNQEVKQAPVLETVYQVKRVVIDYHKINEWLQDHPGWHLIDVGWEGHDPETDTWGTVVYFQKG